MFPVECVAAVALFELAMSDDGNSYRVVDGPAEKRVRPTPEAWVHRYGDLLFRHALIRVGQRELAEDLVQDALLAAWKSREQFAGRASEKTWLLGILRHKIVDYYRQKRLEINLADLDELQGLEEKQFESGWRGIHWHKGAAPKSWPNPRQSLERLEFWQVLYECAAKLPRTTARVFLLREIDDMTSDEICRELKIKPAHLFVLTHRARLTLRRCLELNWFSNRRSKASRAT